MRNDVTTPSVPYMQALLRTHPALGIILAGWFGPPRNTDATKLPPAGRVQRGLWLHLAAFIGEFCRRSGAPGG